MPAPQPWVELTAADLLSNMTEKEKADFGTTSISGQVPDRVAPVLANLVQEIRGYIGSHAGNTLSAGAGLIPAEFVSRAVDIARWRVLATMPGYNPGEARKLSYEKAEAFFRDVARGLIRPRPAPDAIADAVPEERPVGVEVVSGPGSRTGRQRMDGI